MVGMSRIVIVLVSLLLCRLCVIVYAEIEVTYGSENCKSEIYVPDYKKGSVYDKNLKLLSDNLISKSLSLSFYNVTVGTGSDKAYGLFQCRYDLSLNDCKRCVTSAVSYVTTECAPSGEGIVWYFECLVRYSSRDIFSLSETEPVFNRRDPKNVSNYAEFLPILKSTLIDLNDNASSAMPHTATSKNNWANSERLYSYAQCTPDIDSVSCIGCLKTAFAQLIDCCSESTGASIFTPSCQLRYDTTGPFLYGKSSPPPPPPAPSNNQASGTSKKTSLKPAIIAACALVGLLAITVVLWVCAYRRRRKEAKGNVALVSTGKSESQSLGDSEFVQYAFATLKNVTKDFSNENKLGQGGFGSVYKGTLENGEQLAIKRLSGTSGQGTTEFMTEARFLAKLQHKNLVRLLGFCMEGEEKLLVYEFMPNASLDRFLFDATKQPLLDWVTRSKIIMGIARGLQYLHEDSRLTIIHRDLKPANILLDKEMNPKIADFGLAKLFEVAQRFEYTSRIAGTPGYMAPEYMTTGEYSDKSDVYSFGIMLLEIVSGLNNIKCYQSQQEDLPLQAWKLWNEERLFDLTDPALLDNRPSNGVMTRCIQIGLLCLQANPDDRPTMASVAFMLTGSSELPVPSTPAMSFPQFNIPRSYNSGVQSSSGQLSTKSTTTGTNTDQEFDPKPTR